MRRHPQLLLAAVLATAITFLAAYPPHAESADKAVRIAYVGSDNEARSARTIEAFRKRLEELGWKEGQNLILDKYWAEGYLDRFPGLMRSALARKPDLLVTMSTPGALAAKQATSTVPILVAAMGDPVQSGVVSTLAHPGGNITALSTGYADDFAAKWLELALELVPKAKRVAVIWNLSNPVVLQYRSGLDHAAGLRSVALNFIDVRTPRRAGQCVLGSAADVPGCRRDLREPDHTERAARCGVGRKESPSSRVLPADVRCSRWAPVVRR